MKRRFLAVAMSFLMVFSSTPVAAFAEEPATPGEPVATGEPAAGEEPATPGEPTGTDEPAPSEEPGTPATPEDPAGPEVPEPSEEPTVTPGNVTDEAALKTAVAAGGDVVLGGNITLTASLEVSSATVNLNLNGHTITGVSNQDVIAHKAGTLTISGGTIEAQGKGGAVVNYPEATATLTGTTVKGDGWYAIKNLGTMTIAAGSTVTTKDTTNVSSLIANGWYDPKKADANDKNQQHQDSQIATLTIDGGTFTAGDESLNVVKNDEYGKLTINDGTFTGSTNAAVLTYHEAEITGGTFTTTASDVIVNKKEPGSGGSEGKLTISNGTFTSNGAGAAVLNCPGATTALNGGTYKGKDWYAVKNLGTMTISGDTVVATQDQANKSSLVVNGWYNASNPQGNDRNQEHADDQLATLTITGGTFTGGMNTVKNDDYSKLEISGGTFNGEAEDATVLNWNECTISGGTFNATGADGCVVANGWLNDTANKGSLTITGGTFNGESAKEVVRDSSKNDEASKGKAQVTIDNAVAKGTKLLSDQVVGSITITSLESNMKVDEAYVTENNAEVSLTNSSVIPATTTYYVGNSDKINSYVSGAQSGNKIDVLKGSATLSGLKDGVIVKNSGAGTVSANGTAVAQNEEIATGENISVVKNADELKKAVEDGKNAVLSDNITLTDSLEIASGTTLALNLNGYKLTSASDQDVITNKGTLTLSGGSLDAVGTGGAIVNHPDANVTITGTAITGDKWYTIKNLGIMTINDGTLITAKTNGSSLIDNGWYDSVKNGAEKNDRNLVYKEGQTATLKVTGGTFIDGLNNIKNDEYGKLEISGGTFTAGSERAATVLNYNECTISGGTFTATNSNGYVLGNGWSSDTDSKGILVITGGTYNGEAASAIIRDFWWRNTTTEGKGSVSIDNATASGSRLLFKEDGKDSVKFAVDIKSLEANFEVEEQYVTGDRIEVSFAETSEASAPTKYFVGNKAKIDSYLGDVKSGNKITVLKGDATFTGLVDGVKVSNSGTGTVTANGVSVASNSEITIGEKKKITTEADLLEALKVGNDIPLENDITLTKQLEVPEKVSAKLDLNGKKLTGASNQDLISNKGTLVISGSGTLEATGTGGAIVNYPGATATINGPAVSGDKWYAIKNLGTMTIESTTAVSIKDATNESSLIANGWYNPTAESSSNDRNQKHADNQLATLTINGGTFTNNGKSLNLVKNDEYGKLTINDGTFTGSTNAAVLTYHEAEITGGTFTTTASDVVVNKKEPGSAGSNGTLTITGGTFTANGAGAAVLNMSGANATLSGGEYTGKGWYTIKNLGDMTISGEATTVKTADEANKSSLVANGWYDAGTPGGNDRNQAHSGSQLATLTINGGTFTGGMNTIKNDDYSKLTITSGTFKGTAEDATVLNWNECTISGGTFNATGEKGCVIANGWLNNTANKGSLTITGGVFNGQTAREVFRDSSNAGTTAQDKGSITIENATIQGKKFLSDNVKCDVDIKSLESNFKIDETYVTGSNAEVSLTDASATPATTKFFVGTNAVVAPKVAGAKSGDTIDVVKGDATFTGLVNGVIVRNSGTGAVVANEITVAPGTEIVIGSKKDISDATHATITLEPTEFIYNGENQKPTIKITYDDVELTENTDFEVGYPKNPETGEDDVKGEAGKDTTIQLTIKGIGDYSGEVTDKSYSIKLVPYTPMYRLYNQWTYEHFYTAGADERQTLLDRGWSDEQVGWYAPLNETAHPVYRLYNPYTTDHHYTMYKSEYDNLVAAGWSGENVGWYSDDFESVPIYRAYNPWMLMAGSHNYTSGLEEQKHLCDIGWQDEGIGWFGLPWPPGTDPSQNS